MRVHVQEANEMAEPLNIKVEPEVCSTPAVKEPLANDNDIKSEPKSDDKNKSRSGRLIKRTRYLHDEFEETPPVQIKRKRPSEGPPTVSKIKKIDESINTTTTITNTDAESSEFNCEQNHNKITTTANVSVFWIFFVFHLDETEVKQASHIIMNEVTLLQYDVDIKSSLQLSAADTTKCISVLEKYKNLDVTALMLKKNPQVAETIKRLRRYVGNTKEWNFTDEERVDFNEKASKIRKLADTIYKNFKVRNHCHYVTNIRSIAKKNNK